MKPNKLMVVAHPDDETLFGGAQLILQNNWKVICVTNGDNPVRRAEFESVMFITKSQFEIWSYYDEQFVPLDEIDLAKDLDRVVRKQKWNKIVTHNQDGEYGHLHHKQIHQLMRKIVGEQLWTFNFDGPFLLPIDIWQAKVNLVNMHKSQKHITDDHIGNVRNERITRGRVLV